MNRLIALRIKCAGAAAFLVGMLLTVSLRAALPSDANVPTEAVARTQMAKFVGDLARDSYQKVGRHNPELDADVVQYMADVASMTQAKPPEALSWVSLERRGRELYLRGCDDALLQHMYGVCLVATRHFAMAENFVLGSADGLARQKYPANFRARAALSACVLLTELGRPGESGRFADMLIDATTDIFKEHVYGKQRGLLMMAVHDLVMPMTPVQLQRLQQQLSAIPDADPVALLYVEGCYHRNAGWAQRGGGYASEVTPKGFEGFEKEIAQASRCFTKAWEMDHSIPEPAARMIDVAMSSEGVEAMHLWLERTMAARFDDGEAFNAFIFGIYPRWHGSRQMLLDFADECAATGRYDTAVPSFYFDVLQAVSHECDGGDWRVWRDPATYAKAKEILDKTLSAGGAGGREGYFRSLAAALAVRTAHWGDARQAIEQNKGQVDVTAAQQLRLTSAQVKGAAAAYGGDNAADALKGRELVVAGDQVQALELYRAALAAAVDPDAQAFLRGRVQLLQWQTDFNAGAPVALKVDAALDGFNLVAARWEAEPGGGVVGISSVEEMLLVCEAEFGESWDLSVDIDFLRTSPDWDSSGVALTRQGDTNYLGLSLNPKKKTLTVRENRYPERVTAAAPVADHNVMVIHRRGESITITVNGQEVQRDEVRADQRQIGFGGWPLYANSKVAFRNITIRKAN